MLIECETLDDAMGDLLPALIEAPKIGASRGATRELLGVTLIINRPRARISRTEIRGKPFSAMGELLWYLSGANRLDFISYYIPGYKKDSADGLFVHGAYGPRLFSFEGQQNQVANVLFLLRRKPSSRRAMIQVFSPRDLVGEHREIPCTATLQLLIRDGLLHLVCTMRSNDAFLGLPHDVFCFTMLQEMLARDLGVELGTYRHFVGSMHLYEDNVPAARSYIEEAVQPRIEMPPMPLGNPWPSIERWRKAEERIRLAKPFIVDDDSGLDSYWQDLILLLHIFKDSRKGGDAEQVRSLADRLSYPRYASYVNDRITRLLAG